MGTLLAVGSLVAHTAVHQSGGSDLALWQVINLVGAPFLAILFAGPVIDDVKAWIASLRTDQRP